MDILYGRNPVREALRAGRPARKLVVAEGLAEEPRLREIMALAGAQGVRVEMAARGRLDDIAHSEHHQGVAGYFHGRPPLHLERVLESCRPPALLLLLDGIQDPQNLGALIRTAEAVGVDAVITPRHRAAALTPAAVKASAGASEHLSVITVTNLAQALARIGEAGIWRVGLAAEAGERYDRVDYREPTAIVIGGEGEGLRQLTRRSCDRLVSLPMTGRVASLNAAAAGAAILYEAFRQRGFAAR
ncbi:MAG: 23S rRNA (guanosine(2251)-2'-O)-methyltransferase RlmB [Candidatus Dormiibacterota bacterium]|jgi:23S rRNA (guanosine2251-2'-O)-methyltransferase